MVKVSIIVPIFNTERYLQKCLDSIICQTLKDIEIICVNDGSTDSSRQILEEYKNKDSRIKIIDKENSGYGNSMNIGLSYSTGEYIGIVESDDFVENTMFEALYNLAKNNDLDLVKSDFYYYTTNDNQSRKAGKIKKELQNKIFNITDDPTIVKMMPSIWSSLYKRTYLFENGINFLETPGASYQDTSFAFRSLVAAKRIMFTGEAYLYYRQDNENSSVKSKEKVYAVSNEWNEISSFLNKNANLKSIVNDYKLVAQFNGYRWNLIRIDSQYRDEFIDLFSNTFREYYASGEIREAFYRKINKREFQMLLNNKQNYRKYIDKLALNQEKKEKRRKSFSIRINLSRISIVLFGKQIVELG